MTGGGSDGRTQAASRARAILCPLVCVALMLALMPGMTRAQGLQVGPNVNMVSGTTLPGGDPWLQRQNEPSVAVSTRNACTLLAGANDYRTVDMPGLPGDKETGDGWLGTFKSYDCGRTWKTGLLPGYPQDTSAEATSSPLKGLQAGADPIVRAGINGLFFYSGIVFNRGAGGASKVFVARFIDNNDQTLLLGEDSIAYLGTSVVDSGTTGQFLDKPYTAIDVPRGANPPMCTVNGQQVPGGLVYVAWTRFVGQPANNVTKLMVARSRDCGVIWENPVKVSEGLLTNQGAIMAVSPSDGAVYVAWRQLQSKSGKDAIVVAKSTDGGLKFSKGAVVANINPFDQATSPAALSFRTNAYPTVAVDAGGKVYVAWSQRGVGPGGDARIVVATSADGVKWTSPVPVDNWDDDDDIADRGHQIMPAMTIAGGKVQIVYYDLRDDHTILRYALDPEAPGQYAATREWIGDDPKGNVFADAVADNYPNKPLTRRHNVDVRAAQAEVGSSTWTTARVSEYAFGNLIFQEANGARVGVFEQVSFDPPNLPLYAQGTSPFFGDYVDVAAVSFVRDPATGAWKFNAAASGAPPMFHAVWTDNRDVAPPPDENWANYTAPRAGCTPGTTGMRNANVYTAAIMPALVVGSLDNSKPLSEEAPRAFPVFARNTTGQDRLYRFTIEPGAGITWASFHEVDDVPYVDVWIGAWSGAARTVYAKGSTATAPLTVRVTELQQGEPTTNQGTVTLNPDPLSPALMNPALMNETFNPALMNRTISNPALMNPALMNPALMNPALMNPADPAWALANPALMNPALMNPALMNPALMNPALMNPALMNPALMNQEVADPALMNPALMNGLPQDGIITDVTWTVRNDGNAAAAYSIRLLGNSQKQPPSGNGYYSQLILHKRYTTPAPTSATTGPYACQIGERTQDVVLANIPNPLVVSSADEIQVNDERLVNATMALAPGEQGFVTLRIFDPDRWDNVVSYDAASGRYYSYDPVFDPKKDVTLEPESQPANDQPVPNGPYDVTFTPSGQPGNATAGQPIGQVQVHVGGSNPTDVSGALVTITLVPNGNSGLLAGTFTATTNASGVATFSDLTVSDAGIGYELRATVPGADPAISSLFDISPIVAPAGTGNLEFVSQPSSVDGGQPITPPVSVRAWDNTNAPIPGVTVTLVVLNNPGGAVLSSYTSITDPLGIAYFPLLSVDRGGYGYTLQARSGSVSSLPSSSFNVAGFASTANTSAVRRLAHTATRLLDGRVLIAGGSPIAGSATDVAELFDPSGRQFAPTGSLTTPRSGASAAALPDGRVLVSGGSDGASQLGTAEIYDWNLGTFSPVAGLMTTARQYHASLPLPGGNVLIVGGPTTSVEMYDAQAGTFSSAGSLLVLREDASVTMLNDGRVLVAGGSWSGTVFNTAEIFDPVTGFATVVPNAMTQPRYWHSATLLLDGRVLLAGGTDGVAVALSSAEVFDPTTEAFSAVGDMSIGRRFQSATLMPSGEVLVGGGRDLTTSVAAADLFDPVWGTFAPTGTLATARARQTATLLADGTVLAVGGVAPDLSWLPSAEVYYPASPLAASSMTFETGPGDTGTVGQPLPTMTVQLRNGAGVALNHAGVGVMLSILSDVGARLSGTLLARTDASGLATFNNVSVDRAGLCGIRASATLEGVTAPVTLPISIELGTLAFSVQPAGGSAGHALTPAVQVTATKAEGGAMTGSVTLTLTGGPGILLGGPPTEPLAGGTATFGGIIVTTPGSVYVLNALAPGAAASASNGFTVDSYPLPAAGTLAFTAAPSRVTAGQPMAPFSVLATDNLGDPVAGVLVSMSLASNPGGATLFGGVSATTAADGVASFTDVRISLGGYDYSLSASSAPATPVVSAPFDVIGFSSGPLFTFGRAGYTATRLHDGRILLVGGSSTFPALTCLNTAELYDPTTGSITEVTMVAPRYNHTATLLPNGRVLIAGGYCGGAAVNTAETYLPAPGAGGVFEATWPMAAGRETHTATLLPDGKVLVAGGYATGVGWLNSAEVYDSSSGWSTVGALPLALGSSRATLLGNGKVLVSGGVSASGPSANAYLYDPATSSFTSTGSMGMARSAPSATLLPDGRVLIAGGSTPGGLPPIQVVPTAEVYNPTTGLFTPVASMASPRVGHGATLLPSGLVLVAGGYDGNVYLRRAELFDPASETFSATGSLSESRYDTRAVLMSDGQVLLVAGRDATTYRTHAEVYHPADPPYVTPGFETGVSLAAARRAHTATLLPNGLVLVAGGFNASDVPLSSAELCNPLSGSCVVLPASMNTARARHTATLLPNGKVLIVGANPPELFDPQSNTFATTTNASMSRLYHTATLLPNGKVLVIGGAAGTGELYNPSDGSWTAAGGTCSGDPYYSAAALMANGKVLIANPSFENVYSPDPNSCTYVMETPGFYEGYTLTPLPNGKVLMTGLGPTNAALFDPFTGAIVAAGQMGQGRNYHTAALLPNGRVLVAGGTQWPGPYGAPVLSTAELYDPAANTFSPVSGIMSDAHGGQTAVVLPNGKVWIAGGRNASTMAVTTADVYRPR